MMERLQRSIRHQKDACTSKRVLQCARRFALRMFPFLTILRGYSLRYDLPRDIVAGLTVGILHVPQGMAYVLLAGLPPVYGLYTSLYPSIIYFFFGTSRHVSVGTFVVASLMIGAITREGVAAWEEEHPHSAHLMANGSDSGLNTTDSSTGDTVLDIKVAYAMSATFAVGLVQILLGVARVGRVASFMSDALISGFTAGVAMHVLPSQIHSIFGLHFDQYSGMFRLPIEAWSFFQQIHRTQWVTVVTSLVAMLILVAVREGVNNNKKRFPNLPVPIPVELFLLIGTTLVSHYFGFATNYNMQVIGTIPQGIPAVNVSVLRFVPRVLSKTWIPALIFFALSFAASKILAEKHSYTVDANQELIALGMANFLGPFFSSFCCSVTLSRSMVQDEVGGRTQVTGLLSSLLVLIVLLFIGPLLHSLPNCVLAVIIVVSLKRLFLQCTLLPRFWRVSKVDFTVWIVVFSATVLLDLHIGILVGLIFSIFSVLFRTQTPYVSLLGQVDGKDVYADVNGHTKVKEVPGVKIFRFEAALYFGNIHHFRSCLERETGVNVKDLKQEETESKDLINHNAELELPAQDEFLLASGSFKDYQAMTDGPAPSPLLFHPVRVIIVDGSTLQTLDSLTLNVLIQIIKDYKEVGIDVFLAECKPAVWTMLERARFFDHVGREHVFDTIHEAVSQAVQHSS